MTDSENPPGNGSKNRYRASNSFRDEEVNAMLQLFDKLYKGGDVSTIVRSDPCSKVWAKFKKMRDNLDAKTT
jgi:hypothetical protein